ncbi:MAG: aldolase, partial [Chloroflexi bacterium]|nr:aldolase [Chloroflexota bacterium]
MTSVLVAPSVAELLTALEGICRVQDGRLLVADEARLRDEGIRTLAWTATFSEDDGAIEAARWLIWEASQTLGAPSASIHELYMARGRGEVGGFTVPAINLRTQVMDMT